MTHGSSHLRLSHVVQMSGVDQMPRRGHWHPGRVAQACCARQQGARQAKKLCRRWCSLVTTCKKDGMLRGQSWRPLLGDDFWEPLLPLHLTASLGSWGFFLSFLCGDAELMCSWRGGPLALGYHF